MSEKERLCKMGRANGAICVIVLSVILSAVSIAGAADGSEVTLVELAGEGRLTERAVEGFLSLIHI